MPQFTISLSEEAIARLQHLVERHNANHGTGLTVRDWIVLQLRDLAVREELLAAAQSIKRRHEEEAEADLAAEHEHLLATV